MCVKRGELPTQKQMKDSGAHQSEWDWLASDFDITIDNDGTLDDLYAKVDDLIVSNKIAHTPTQSADSSQPLAIGANSF